MARGGRVFTDAHAGTALCSPTRYGILTGRYAWRSRLKSGVLWGYSRPLIPTTRLTVPALLKKQGYTTGCVGKWHLGSEWILTDSVIPKDTPDEPGRNVDLASPIRHSPRNLGFDYFFGISASLDMPPYVYIENENPPLIYLFSFTPSKSLTLSQSKRLHDCSGRRSSVRICPAFFLT